MTPVAVAVLALNGALLVLLTAQSSRLRRDLDEVQARHAEEDRILEARREFRSFCDEEQDREIKAMRRERELAKAASQGRPA